jgi:hypothetical protein
MTVEFIQTIPNVLKIRKQLNFHPFNNCRYNFQMFEPSDTISMTLTWTKKPIFSILFSSNFYQRLTLCLII